MESIRRATLDRDKIKELVFKSHLEVSSNTEEELEIQKNDLENDFPQLLNEERFKKTITR